MGKLTKPKKTKKTKKGEGKGVIGELGTRFEAWREGEKIKGYRLAKMIDISQGSLSEILNNKTHPCADTLALIHANTELNILWLLSGKGNATKLSQDDAEFLTSDLQLNRIIQRCIDIYRQGDNAKKAQFSGYLAGLESS